MGSSPLFRRRFFVNGKQVLWAFWGVFEVQLGRYCVVRGHYIVLTGDGLCGKIG